MQIAFHHQAAVALRNRTSLKKFLGTLLKREGRGVGSVSYVFCTDAYLIEINRQYLNHDDYTDIITFDLSQSGSKLIDAEMYISVNRVKENAAMLGRPFKEELHRVIFHGALHLCGYKDKTLAATKLMRAKEEEYLSLYFS